MRSENLHCEFYSDADKVIKIRCVFCLSREKVALGRADASKAGVRVVKTIIT